MNSNIGDFQIWESSFMSLIQNEIYIVLQKRHWVEVFCSSNRK